MCVCEIKAVCEPVRDDGSIQFIGLEPNAKKTHTDTHTHVRKKEKLSHGRIRLGL